MSETDPSVENAQPEVQDPVKSPSPAQESPDSAPGKPKSEESQTEFQLSADDNPSMKGVESGAPQSSGESSGKNDDSSANAPESKETQNAPDDKKNSGDTDDHSSAPDGDRNEPSSKGEKEKDGNDKPKRSRNNQRNRRPRRKKDGGENADSEDEGENSGQSEEGKQDNNDGQPKKTRKERYLERKEKERAKEAAALEAAPPVESEGLVEISPKGFGFLRERGRSFQQSPKDVFVTPEIVRVYGLRDGLWVKCISKQGIRGPQMIELLTINGKDPSEYENLPYFEELTAINPNKKLTLETETSRMTTRVIDMMAPIGRGQRGLIVAPPRTGKTTLLHHIAEGIQKNYEDEIHLMILLVDERPEEVTDFKRSFPDLEVFSSSNDGEGKDHTRIALLAIERAKRLVEAGEHVFILMDSITRLARAFNTSMRGGKRGTASGGLIVGALEIPRKIFAAARNTREAGSLTIVATALIQTNSKADEAIFQEFKGTGNMELVLDRQLAQNYVYPAVDIHKSGTRREELLLPPHMLEKIYVIRRGLGGYKQIDAMEWLLKCMERYPSNAQMLMDIKTTALS